MEVESTRIFEDQGVNFYLNMGVGIKKGARFPIGKLKTQRFVLVAVDIADRTVYTAAQKSKTAEETLRTFKEIIRENAGVMPKEITIDLGK